MLSPASIKRMRYIIALGIICMASLLGPLFAYSQEKNIEAEDLIRSAMVYNFCKFVQWPGEVQDTLILGILSLPGSGNDFSSINGKIVHEATIEIRQITGEEDFRACHLVFIDEDLTNNLEEAFAMGQDESILTISEMDDFCSQGGIIQLVHRRGKLRFFINRRAATESQLVLSSQLLKMAKIVEGD